YLVLGSEVQFAGVQNLVLSPYSYQSSLFLFLIKGLNLWESVISIIDPAVFSTAPSPMSFSIQTPQCSKIGNIMIKYDKVRALIAEVKEESADESESEIEADQEFESNKQKEISSPLEEVMHDLKGHAISSELEVCSTFVHPYMEVPLEKRRKRRQLIKMALRPVPRVSQREAKGTNNNNTGNERAFDIILPILEHQGVCIEKDIGDGAVENTAGSIIDITDSQRFNPLIKNRNRDD
ncbi:MAG: hypothetical protein EZS28_041795, partial [Streblomastix strix]